jgi:beta-phosphoglucomutase-like phosphatase (HAD superfamily)
VHISQERHLVSPDEHEAWLFDLEGVITDRASVHAAAWRATFDEYLKGVSEREEKSCEPFEKKLAGRPSCDTCEEATRMLGTPLERAVVIECAISGVQAGRTGGFGLVIGVARSDDPDVLRQNGTDIVVRDLAHLSLV